MKNTDKNSRQNKLKKEQSSNTLLYILLFVMLAVLVGSLTWHFWPTENKQNHDYEEELGEKLTSPTAKDVSKLIQGNRSRIKRAKRVLEGKVRGRTLSEKEKKEVEEELKNVDNSFKKLDEILQKIELKVLEETIPSELADIYSLLYEQGKVTVRLKDKTSIIRSKEELKKQLEIQEKWHILDEEEKKIREEMDKWITKWYLQARKELIESGKYPLLTEYVVPSWDKGKKIEGEPTQEQIGKHKKLQNFEDKKTKQKKAVDYSSPLEIVFKGYYGFLTEKDKEGSPEGKEIFGLTKPRSKVFFYYPEWVKVDEEQESPIGTVPSDFYLVKVFKDNRLEIKIGLEKKLFFNRLGHEEWLNKVNYKGERTYFDIHFEDVVDTIAHELAHAIVNTTRKDYEGQEGGGHGRFFYKIMKQIEEMIKNSPDSNFKEFENWWKQPEKEQKEWSIDSIVAVKKSHWDEWKYWYIGGGVGILVVGLAIVVVFWDELTDSKKNVKN